MLVGRGHRLFDAVPGAPVGDGDGGEEADQGPDEGVDGPLGDQVAGGIAEPGDEARAIGSAAAAERGNW
ncbi:hypothetical protein STENM223S_04452 [Streptomyces tendae]